jgi:hypothetical protein
MSKFFPFFLTGIILILLITGFLMLAKNNGLRKTFNVLASIKDAFQNLFSSNYIPARQEVVTPIVKEEDLEEETIEKEKFEENSDLEQPSPLDEIVEKIDEISEKVDLLTQEVEKLLGKEIKEEEISTEEDEEEIEEEETIEEIEEFEEEDEGPEEQNIPEKEIILCQRGNQSPIRDKVIFNEISWMGTNEDWRNEWFELKNISGDDISFKGWQILDKEQEIKIIFEEKDKILAGRLFLLERTNDDSVPGILADKIYSGNLNDENKTLYLFDENCQLQDEVIANPDWPAGDKNERKSMERDVDFGWYTYSGGSNYGIFGTPKAENSPKFVFSSSGGGLPPPEEIVIPPKILITEVQIEGDKKSYDFIELYNPSDNLIDISGYQLKKRNEEGTESSLGIFLEGSQISARDYFLWACSKDGYDQIINADISFKSYYLIENNSIGLYNKEKRLIDALGWGESENPFLETVAFSQNPDRNQSLGRKWLEEEKEYQDIDNNQEDFEIQDPTPKEKNQNSSTLLPSVVEDDIAPEVNFDSISSLQTETSFSLSWVGQDLAPENVTPSGIDGFLLRYSEDNKENWTYWPSETEYTQETQYPFEGKDEKVYYFQIKAKDKAGNESDWTEILIEINTHPIVINEVYYDVVGVRAKKEITNG